MPVPDKIKVGGFFYRVISDGSCDLEMARDGNRGETDHNAFTVKLISDRESRWKEILVHEVLHCVALHTHLVDTWGEQDEDYVRRLGDALYMVFRDNPELLAFWAED